MTTSFLDSVYDSPNALVAGGVVATLVALIAGYKLLGGSGMLLASISPNVETKANAPGKSRKSSNLPSSRHSSSLRRRSSPTMWQCEFKLRGGNNRQTLTYLATGSSSHLPPQFSVYLSASISQLQQRSPSQMASPRRLYDHILRSPATTSPASSTCSSSLTPPVTSRSTWRPW
jgi:hypothetical protein